MSLELKFSLVERCTKVHRPTFHLKRCTLVHRSSSEVLQFVMHPMNR
jgi:hypothetical protein